MSNNGRCHLRDKTKYRHGGVVLCLIATCQGRFILTDRVPIAEAGAGRIIFALFSAL